MKNTSLSTYTTELLTILDTTFQTLDASDKVALLESASAVIKSNVMAETMRATLYNLLHK